MTNITRKNFLSLPKSINETLFNRSIKFAPDNQDTENKFSTPDFNYFSGGKDTVTFWDFQHALEKLLAKFITYGGFGSTQWISNGKGIGELQTPDTYTPFLEFAKKAGLPFDPDKILDSKILSSDDAHRFNLKQYAGYLWEEAGGTWGPTMQGTVLARGSVRSGSWLKT